MFALFWLKFVPGGYISYTHDLEGENNFISDITPAGRVVEEDGRVKIVGDPAYFFLRTPRPFRTATITLKYRFSAEDSEVMELGILADNINWRYKTKPVENKIIDRLFLVWDKIERNGDVLLQKQKKYASPEDFLDNPPPGEEIALYNYDWNKSYLLKDYEAVKEGARINIPFQGSFQFYTYIKEEPLDVEFKFWDVNENEERDDFSINLYHRNKLISSKNISGDGVQEDTGEANSLGRAGFNIRDLTEGVYKVEVHANDDIITEGINSRQQKISFQGDLQLAKPEIPGIDVEELYPFQLHTDSAQISAKTVHPASLQSLVINGEEGEMLKIEETYKKFSRSIEPSSDEENSISIKKPGVILSGDGVFSFDPDSLFNPDFNKLRSERVADGEIKYVLAGYQEGGKEGKWKKKKVRFDLGSAYSEDGKYKFLLSVPGLENDDGIDDHVVVDEIKVELKGYSIPEILKRKLKIWD